VSITSIATARVGHTNRLIDQAHNALADAGRMVDAGRHAEAATRLLDAAAIAAIAADELDGQGVPGG
jgi:hypothetical protein